MPARADHNRQNFEFLREAYRSFKKKQYANATVILEKSISGLSDDPYPFFLLAITRLYCGDLSGANIVMEKLQRVNPSYAPFLQLRAFLGLKSAPDRNEAIAVYLNVIEKAPSDRLLRKGLRRCEETRNFSRFQKEAKLTDLVTVKGPDKISIRLDDILPHRRRRVVRRRSRLPLTVAALVILSLAVAAGAYFSGIRSLDDITRMFVSTTPSYDQRIDMVDISGSGYGLINRINRGPVKEFYSSSDVMVSEFNEAKRLIKKGELNRAAVMLNRIINSNSSEVVKEKCEFLVRFIIDNDDRVYEAPDIKAMQEKPYLYRGVALDLSGKVANVKSFDTGTGFTLMVDYDGKNFRWIAQVFTSKHEAAENGDDVRVRGVYIAGIGTDNNAYVSSAKVQVIR